jgi:hypothetical protein
MTAPPRSANDVADFRREQHNDDAEPVCDPRAEEIEPIEHLKAPVPPSREVGQHLYSVADLCQAAALLRGLRSWRASVEI